MSHFPSLHLKSHFNVCISLLCSESSLPLPDCEFTAQWKVPDEFSIAFNIKNWSCCIEFVYFLCTCIDWNRLCLSISLIIVCICPSSTHAPQKKLPLTALSQAMVEGGSQLGEESLIGWVCDWLTGQKTNCSSLATVANGAVAPPESVKYEAMHSGQAICPLFCRRDFQQFPYWRFTSFIVTEGKAQNRSRQFVVEDLESECLQMCTAAVCLPGSNEEGKVRQIVC